MRSSAERITLRVRASALPSCRSAPPRKFLWHYHNNVHDTFYVIEGAIRIFLQDPKEQALVERGQTFSVPPKRPHLVTNAGKTSAVFLVLQGLGEYDFVPLT